MKALAQILAFGLLIALGISAVNADDDTSNRYEMQAIEHKSFIGAWVIDNDSQTIRLCRVLPPTEEDKAAFVCSKKPLDDE